MNIIGNMHDVQFRRGMGGGLSYHMAVFCRLTSYCRQYMIKNVDEKNKKDKNGKVEE